MVSLMDWAEARIVDLGRVCVMTKAMVRKGRVDDPKVYLRKLWADDPEFFCFVFESRCFRIGRWRWSSMMEYITYNLGEFYLPDANTGRASIVVFPLLCCPCKL